MNTSDAEKQKAPHHDAVLFDWDGCLANTLEIWIEAVRVGFQNRSMELTRQQIISDTIIEWGKLHKYGITDSQAFALEATQYIEKNVLTIQLNPQAPEVLKQLDDMDKKIAVVTSSRPELVLPLLEHHNIKQYFDTVVTCTDVTRIKPDPEPLHTALSRMNIRPDAAMMVGDTQNDIIGGKRAGTTTVMYYPSAHELIYDKDLLLGLNADYYIRNLQDVIGLV